MTIPEKKKRRGGEMPDPGLGVLLLACIPATTPAFPESVRNRVILGTFKARKQIYSGAK